MSRGLLAECSARLSPRHGAARGLRGLTQLAQLAQLAQASTASTPPECRAAFDRLAAEKSGDCSGHVCAALHRSGRSGPEGGRTVPRRAMPPMGRTGGTGGTRWNLWAGVSCRSQYQTGVPVGQAGLFLRPDPSVPLSNALSISRRVTIPLSNPGWRNPVTML